MGGQTEGDPHRFAQRLFAGLPARYDRLGALLSLGQDRRWRRAVVDHVVAGLGAGAASTSRDGRRRQRAVDVATGTAGVALAVARRSGAAVVGVDLSMDMVRQGAAVVAASGSNPGTVVLAVGNAEALPLPDATADALTFTYLLRYVADVDATMAELARVLRPGAPVASLDFAVPSSRFWWAWWWAYTRLVLPVAGALTGGKAWYDVGRFLGPNISGFYRRTPVSSIVDAWEHAGLVDVEVRRMSLGGGVVMTGRRSSGGAHDGVASTPGHRPG